MAERVNGQRVARVAHYQSSVGGMLRCGAELAKHGRINRELSATSDERDVTCSRCSFLLQRDHRLGLR